MSHPVGQNGTALIAPMALAQGLYYLSTGLWSVVSLSTFQKVTGPKTDRWLVQANGLQLAVAGAVLTVAGLRRSNGPEIPLLGAGSAAGQGGIDLFYAGVRRRISRVYLIDALVEAVLPAGPVFGRGASRR